MQAKMTVKECAELFGKSEQFIRLGLQRGEFSFGHAVKMSSRWSYHISRFKVYEYLGISRVTVTQTVRCKGNQIDKEHKTSYTKHAK